MYVKGKDLLVSGTKEAEKEIKDQLINIDNKLKKDGDEYLEKYTAYIMDSMQKNQKFEKMQFMKIKPSKNLDLKAKMLKDYQGENGDQFKNIDMERVELEAKIKHMPLSIERMTVQCKNDIAQCSNYQEFRS